MSAVAELLTAPAPAARPARVSKAAVARMLTVGVPILFWYAPLGMAPKIQHVIAVTLFMIVAWITHAMDHALAGLAGCFLFWALKLVTFGVAFGGFSEPTPWFLFGAMLFGMMASKTGLARRIAYLVMLRIGSTYSRLLLGLIVSNFLLTFVAPSGIARVILMATIALGLIEAFGLDLKSNVARGMFIILTYTTGIFDKVVIAGAAAIAARGLIESVGHVEVLWSRWLLAFMPFSLLTILIAWRYTLRCYPPEKPALPGGSALLRQELHNMGPWSPAEKKAALLIGFAVALWMTDFWHHISPAMIGLGIGLLAAFPVIGVLETEDLKKLNYLPIFFTAAAICMGNVLMATKTLDFLTGAIVVWLHPLVVNSFTASLVLYWSGCVYHVFLGDEVAMLSTSIPIIMKFAHANGMNPLFAGMVWTLSAGGRIFVYQSAVLVVGYSYGSFTAKDMFRIGVFLTVVESLLLLVFAPLYWPLIGIHY
jgi:anion transporter